MKRKILVNTYGSAFPLKMDLDRQILSRYDNSSCIDVVSLLVCSKLEHYLKSYNASKYAVLFRTIMTFVIIVLLCFGWQWKSSHTSLTLPTHVALFLLIPRYARAMKIGCLL